MRDIKVLSDLAARNWNIKCKKRDRKVSPHTGVYIIRASNECNHPKEWCDKIEVSTSSSISDGMGIAITKLLSTMQYYKNSMKTIVNYTLDLDEKNLTKIKKSIEDIRPTGESFEELISKNWCVIFDSKYINVYNTSIEDDFKDQFSITLGADQVGTYLSDIVDGFNQICQRLDNDIFNEPRKRATIQLAGLDYIFPEYDLEGNPVINQKDAYGTFVNTAWNEDVNKVRKQQGDIKE
jgi:phosphoribosylformylglycinamidine (FGAM) synthase PurS component